MLIGLSASLPLMVTLEQRQFYLVTAMPFFALAIGCWVGVPLMKIVASTSSDSYRILQSTTRKWQMGFGLLFCGILVYSFLQKDKFSRNAAKIRDSYIIGAAIPERTIIGCDSSIYPDWGTQAQLMRHFRVSVDPENLDREFYLVPKGMPMPIVGTHKRAPLQTEKFDLYRKLH